jgi:peptide/nickel transport system substrate-binding protein
MKGSLNMSFSFRRLLSTRKVGRSWLLISASFIILVSLLFGQLQPSTALAAPLPPALNPFTVAISSDISGLDPALATDNTTLLVTNQVFETLVNYEEGGTLPVPGLASSWSATPDGLTWTFTLRPGVKFQDNTDLDAAAVAFNLQRWWDPENTYHTGSFDTFSAYFKGFKGDADCLLTAIDTPAANQVRLTLAVPMGNLLSVLAMPAFAIASPTAIVGGELDLFPIGTGAFTFQEKIGGDHITLIPNSDYWGTPPVLNPLTFKIIPDEATRVAALHAGTVNVVNDLTKGAAVTALSDHFLKVLWRPAMNMGYLGITASPSHPVLNILKVRQAIAHAINLPALIAATYLPGDQAATQFLPPSIWGFKPDLAYDYNPALALQLLSEAGYANGFITTLSYRTDRYRDYMPDTAATALAIQADLAAVHITANLQLLSTSDLTGGAYSGNLELYLLGWMADYGHPDNFFSPHFCDPTNHQFGTLDSQFCADISAAWNEPSLANQLADYQAASQTIFDRVPVISLANSRPGFATGLNVYGLVPSATGIESYKNVFFKNQFWLPLLKR